MTTGTVKWFNSQKGYGFIQPTSGGNDVFVHISAVERAGMDGLQEGQKLSFELEQGQRGRASAVHLRPAWPSVGNGALRRPFFRRRNNDGALIAMRRSTRVRAHVHGPRDACTV